MKRIKIIIKSIEGGFAAYNPEGSKITCTRDDRKMVEMDLWKLYQDAEWDLICLARAYYIWDLRGEK